jgi:hypothetical protein
MILGRVMLYALNILLGQNSPVSYIYHLKGVDLTSMSSNFFTNGHLMTLR